MENKTTINETIEMTQPILGLKYRDYSNEQTGNIKNIYLSVGSENVFDPTSTIEYLIKLFVIDQNGSIADPDKADRNEKYLNDALGIPSDSAEYIRFQNQTYDSLASQIQKYKGKAIQFYHYKATSQNEDGTRDFQYSLLYKNERSRTFANSKVSDLTATNPELENVVFEAKLEDIMIDDMLHYDTTSNRLVDKSIQATGSKAGLYDYLKQTLQNEQSQFGREMFNNLENYVRNTPKEKITYIGILRSVGTFNKNRYNEKDFNTLSPQTQAMLSQVAGRDVHVKYSSIRILFSLPSDVTNGIKTQDGYERIFKTRSLKQPFYRNSKPEDFCVTFCHDDANIFDFSTWTSFLQSGGKNGASLLTNEDIQALSHSNNADEIINKIVEIIKRNNMILKIKINKGTTRSLDSFDIVNIVLPEEVDNTAGTVTEQLNAQQNTQQASQPFTEPAQQPATGFTQQSFAEPTQQPFTETAQQPFTETAQQPFAEPSNQSAPQQFATQTAQQSTQSVPFAIDDEDLPF